MHTMYVVYNTLTGYSTEAMRHATRAEAEADRAERDSCDPWAAQYAIREED
jgi:hypothetical protein